MIHNNSPVIIALCGKGGVGKTSISAMISGTLSKSDSRRILVIDADPAVGLATALGINVEKTINDIRNDIIKSITDGEGMDREEMIARIDYDLLDALEETENLAFLAIGRPEDEGCYCQLNSFLKEIISRLARKFDYVVIDGEAGIEQINRRVMEMVTHLFLITDTSLKGHKVLEQINEIADRAIQCSEKGVLVNRIRSGDENKNLYIIPDLPVICRIPEDDTVRNFDMDGKSFLAIPPCKALSSVESLIQKIVSKEERTEIPAI